MPDTILVRLETSQQDAEAEQAAAEGSDEITIKSVEPIEAADPADPTVTRFVGTVAIIAATSISWIAGRMATTWLKDKEQGVQIDLRDRPATISRIAGVPNGFVVIINPDGTAETQKVDYENPDQLTALLTQVLSRPG